MQNDTKLILEKLEQVDQRVTEVQTVLEVKIEQVDQRITGVQTVLEEKIEQVDQRVTEVQTVLEEKIEQVDQRITEVQTVLEEKIEQVDQRITGVQTVLEEKIEQVDQRVIGAEEKLSDIQLTLENETYKSIYLIAEGHQELNRKVNDVMKHNDENELLLVRVIHLENEMRNVKKHITEIA